MFFDLNQCVCVNMFGHVHKLQGYWHPIRAIPQYLLIYLTQGTLRMAIQRTTYRMEAGHMLLIPPDTPYRPLESDGCTYYFFHFSATECEESPYAAYVHENTALPSGDYAYFYNNPPESVIEVAPHTICGNIPSIQSLFERAAAIRIGLHPGEKLLMDNLLRELLIQISRTLRSGFSMDPKLRKMILYIQEHYAEPITLPALAKRFSVSESYAARLFRQELHTRSSDYINQVRLAAACDLLVNSELPVHSVAERVGYASAYYFSRVFRARYQMTPRDFRRQHPSELPIAVK